MLWITDLFNEYMAMKNLGIKIDSKSIDANLVKYFSAIQGVAQKIEMEKTARKLNDGNRHSGKASRR